MAGIVQIGRVSVETQIHITRCEVFTAVDIEVEVCWFVTPCSVAVGYTTRALHHEDGGNMALRNVDIPV
jgi:hypothetical protein